MLGGRLMDLFYWLVHQQQINKQDVQNKDVLPIDKFI